MKLTLCIALLVMAAGNHVAHYRFENGVALNDLDVTPGEVRTLDKEAICNGGSTKQFRHTTEKMKAAVYAEYGIDKHKIYRDVFCTTGMVCDKNPKPPYYEVDHLCSLELGCADTIANLYIQPYYAHPGAHEKDQVENWLRRKICAGEISPTDAQRRISTDWYLVYLEMLKERVPLIVSGSPWESSTGSGIYRPPN